MCRFLFYCFQMKLFILCVFTPRNKRGTPNKSKIKLKKNAQQNRAHKAIDAMPACSKGTKEHNLRTTRSVFVGGKKKKRRKLNTHAAINRILRRQKKNHAIPPNQHTRYISTIHTKREYYKLIRQYMLVSYICIFQPKKATRPRKK